MERSKPSKPIIETTQGADGTFVSSDEATERPVRDRDFAKENIQTNVDTNTQNRTSRNRRKKTQASPESPGTPTRKSRRTARSRAHNPSSSDTEATTSNLNERNLNNDEKWAFARAKEIALFDNLEDEVDETLDDGVDGLLREDEVDETLDDGVDGLLREDDLLIALVDARTALAEASIKAHEGTVISNGRYEKRLVDRANSYQAARNAFIEAELDELGDTTLARKAAFISMLSAREDGALMGEEANYHIDRGSNTTYEVSENDDSLTHSLEKTSDARSKMQTAFEKYNNLSTKKKVIYGLGVAAAGSVFVGLTVGGTIAGLATAAGMKFGRNYFTGEASRRAGNSVVPDEFVINKDDTPEMVAEKQAGLLTFKRGSTVDAMQNNSLFRSGNHDGFVTSLDGLTTEANRDDSTYKSLLFANANETNTAHDVYINNIKESEERVKETSDKRKVLGKAALIVAAGTSVGLAAEYISGWNGTIRGELDDYAAGSGNGAEAFDGLGDVEVNDQPEINVEHPTDLEQEQSTADAERAPTDLESEQEAAAAENVANAEIAAENVAAAEIAAENNYLYGEFAGEHLDISIESGDNLWDELEAAVDRENPYISFDEKQRLVGNMLNVIQENNPGRNLDLVHSGETFSFDIPG